MDRIYQNFEDGRIYNGDCLEIMKDIPDRIVDMILCDLPYGTTQNKWDSVIPLVPLWDQYWRILKEDGVIVLTAAQPFTSILVSSQIKYFKYEWIWEKHTATGFLNAKKQPLRNHESICVFYKNQCLYNPQWGEGKPYKTMTGSQTSNYNDFVKTETISDGRRYPVSVQKFNKDKIKIHPTQKPVALFEYLIKTYSNEGEVILDNCSGSGTSAIAAINLNRQWICMEQDEKYYNESVKRISSHVVSL